MNEIDEIKEFQDRCILKACDWLPCGRYEGCLHYKCGTRIETESVTMERVHKDLNLLHEAFLTLEYPDNGIFINWLHTLTHGTVEFAETASAEIRREAWLRTKGLWDLPVFMPPDPVGNLEPLGTPLSINETRVAKVALTGFLAKLRKHLRWDKARQRFVKIGPVA